ncbi:GIY-YIG nuclease family protein [Pararoseomonas sp. SCSIO 73927]|uniref:GIY-YIG nuclease family protein n=1 Tax=Pararoseomonas sp. SCSIO 73927 TaxID=3114537 RepID=UPI0030CD7C4E
MPELTAETLLNTGFKDIGVWSESKDGKGIEYHLDGINPEADRLLLAERNALYAFVHGEKVNYVGKTARSILKRFVGYRKPHKGQRTNWRCNEKIRELLARGETVRIYVFTPLSHLRYAEFEINLAAGLEDALIAAFDPPWNGRDGARPVTEEAEREALEEEGDLEAASGSGSPPPGMAALNMPGTASFGIRLGEAYYRQGFINPGVDASRFLGGDGEPMSIVFDDGTEEVISAINRKANRTGSVRVVGRNRLIAEWFQKHFREGETVEARVLSRNRILLISKAA